MPSKQAVVAKPRTRPATSSGGATEQKQPEALRPGEVDLILRALRYYVHGEQVAISNALLEARRTKRNKDALHAADVKQQAQSHIDAAQALHIKLRARMLRGEVTR